MHNCAQLTLTVFFFSLATNETTIDFIQHRLITADLPGKDINRGMNNTLLLRTLRHGAGRQKPYKCLMRGLGSNARSFFAVGAQRLQNANAEDDNNIEPEHPTIAETLPKPSSTQRAVPWYLRKDVKQDFAPSVHSKHRQLLPELPDNPPPILEDALPHISTALGVDDLTLLDLRHLDPPPALGTNLIMIIGTARSIKHLNVAADKLCRWLRREHGLTPNADGLLGRQELKVRLRRKSKRSKLARSVGGTWEQTDDGIVTGWISVDVGMVDDGRPVSDAARKEREAEKEAGFVGFGSDPGGCHLVVQLMTEEKRADVDLESLWGDSLGRNAEPPGIDGSGVHRPTVGPSALAPRDIGLGQPSDFSSNKSPNLFRSRSTQSRHMSTVRQTHDPQTPISRRTMKQPSKIHVPSNGPETTLPSLQNLSNSSPEEQRQQLGSGPSDRDSTPFLRQFYDEYTAASVIKRTQYMTQLTCLAIHSHHPAYTKLHLFNAFMDFAASTPDISIAQILRVLDAMLVRRPLGVIDPLNPPPLCLPDSDLDLFLRIISYMGVRGMNDLRDNTLTLTRLYLAVSFNVPVYLCRKTSSPQSVDTERGVPVSHREIKAVTLRQTRLRKLMKILENRFSHDHFPQLLRAHLYQGDFHLFWQFWCHAPFLGITRTRDHYRTFFELLAERANVKAICEALSTYVPMMEREEVPVRLDGELAKAVMRCLVIVDSSLPERAERGGKGPFVALWTRCMENVHVAV